MLFTLPLVFVVGCIHEPVGVHLMGVPVGGPSPDPAHVSSCKTTRFWQNFWAVGGALSGAAAAATGGATAIPNESDSVKTGAAITAAATGILAALATASGGIESAEFSTDNCEQILQDYENASVSH